MAGPNPITGLPSNRYIQRPQAPPESVHGGPSDPLHGQFGEQAQPYPWQEYAGPHGPYGPAEDLLLSDLPETETFAAGHLGQDPSADLTPYRTHGGPRIRGMEMDRGPDGNSRVLRQSYEAHSVDTGAARKARASSDPQQDHWEGFYNLVAGDDEVPVTPGAIAYQANGFGVNDRRSNPMAKVNQYGFATSHRLRRFATGSVPGNYMWMLPAGRPMNKTLAGPARPATGEGPFSGQDTTASFGYQGATLQDPATEYVSPPQPLVVPATQDSEDYAPAIALW